MAQEDNSTQTPQETLDTSTQPEKLITDLDGASQSSDEAPAAGSTAEDVAPESVSDSVAEDSQFIDEVRNLIAEQSDAIENLKKGLYEKGREAAELKKQLEPADSPKADQTDVEAAIDLLKENGFMTREDLNAFKFEQEERQKLDNIVSANPTIDRQLLEDLGKANPDMAYEDIVAKHKRVLLGDNELQKAHSRPVMGEPIAKEAPKQKGIADMNSDEFKQFIKSKSKGNTIGGNFLK